MKSERQEKLLQIIKNKDMETQEELVEELQKQGINVKQSTLSRDIKELGVTKVLVKGRYKYMAMERKDDSNTEKLLGIFANTVVKVEMVEKFIVIKTISGSAPAAAEAIDILGFDGIAGTIAGDNTIFILCRNEEYSKSLLAEINELIKK